VRGRIGIRWPPEGGHRPVSAVPITLNDVAARPCQTASPNELGRTRTGTFTRGTPMNSDHVSLRDLGEARVLYLRVPRRSTDANALHHITGTPRRCRAASTSGQRGTPPRGGRRAHSAHPRRDRCRRGGTGLLAGDAHLPGRVRIDRAGVHPSMPRLRGDLLHRPDWAAPGFRGAARVRVLRLLQAARPTLDCGLRDRGAKGATDGRTTRFEAPTGSRLERRLHP
jgi:hypothetical protein